MNQLFEPREKYLVPGDYVLATKYSDGDPMDQWCVGFFKETLYYDPIRYLVVNDQGQPFRANGFRRVERLSADEGKWILDHKDDISCPVSVGSLWDWLDKAREELATNSTN